MTKMGIPSSKDEGLVILEACSLSEKFTMGVASESSTPYFYFDLPLIMDMGSFPHLPFGYIGFEDP